MISGSVGEGTLTMGLVVLEGTLVCVLWSFFVFPFKHCQLPTSASLPLEELSAVDFLAPLLHSLTMFEVLAVLSCIAIVSPGLFESPLPLEGTIIKISFKGRSVSPLELAYSMFFSILVLASVGAFVVFFDAFPMRLLIYPASLIS